MNRMITGGNVLSVSRRGIIKTGLGVGAAGLLAPLTAPHVWAKTYPTMGTFPAGVQGKTAFAAGMFPLTGPYASLGRDEKNGFQLAIEQLNNGSKATDMIPSLKKGGGVLGKQMVFGIADSQTHSNPAVQAATRFIDSNNAIVMTGSVSSAIAVALEGLGQRKKVIYLADISGSNATTGKDCQRFGFRITSDAYMAAQALAPVLAKQFGRNRKAAYLIPDYTYGTTLYTALTEAFSKFGWTIATEQLAPIGTTDFTSYLLDIANSGADVMFNATVGADEVTSTKQAVQFGIMKRMKFVLPIFSPFLEKPLGPDVLGGIYGAIPWYWGVQDKIPMAKVFNEAFHKKFNYVPRFCAAFCYTSMIMWADAVERAGTFYPPEVITALESGHKVDTVLGEVSFRAEDHQAVVPVPIVQGKTKSEIQGPADNYKIIEIVPGEQVMEPIPHTGCHMPSVGAA